MAMAIGSGLFVGLLLMLGVLAITLNMAALSANRVNTVHKIDARDVVIVIKNGVTVYEGSLVCVDANGVALPATSGTASLRFAGVCIRSDGAGNAGGTNVCVVRRRGSYVFAKASAAATDLFLLAWASTDQDVVSAAPGNAYIVGRIIRIVDSANVEVDLEDRVA